MDIKNFYIDKGFVVIKKLISEEIIMNVKSSLEIFKKSNKQYYTQSNHTWFKIQQIIEAWIFN